MSVLYTRHPLKQNVKASLNFQKCVAQLDKFTTYINILYQRCETPRKCKIFHNVGKRTKEEYAENFFYSSGDLIP